MKNILPFNYQDITLRLLTEEDLLHTLAWRNTYRKWFNDTGMINLEMHLHWFQTYLKKNNDFVFIVENEQKDRLGQVAIYDIRWDINTAEFGRFLVNPRFTGKGFMKKACQAMITLCHTKFNITHIRLEVKENNEKAIKIYKHCGFIITERLASNNILMQHQ